MPNINDSIIDFNDFNAEPQLLRDIQDGKAIAFYSFAHLLLNADGTPYTMSKGVQLSGNYDTLNALKAAFPKGNSNLYIVNEDSKIYYWNGADWVVGGGINVNYASTLELDSPSESTSGTLTSTQLDTLKSNTFTQIKLGNFIYRKQAVVGQTKMIYKTFTDDHISILSVNVESGAWTKETYPVNVPWTVDDIPNNSISDNKLINNFVRSDVKGLNVMSFHMDAGSHSSTKDRIKINLKQGKLYRGYVYAPTVNSGAQLFGVLSNGNDELIKGVTIGKYFSLIPEKDFVELGLYINSSVPTDVNLYIEYIPNFNTSDFRLIENGAVGAIEFSIKSGVFHFSNDDPLLCNLEEGNTYKVIIKASKPVNIGHTTWSYPADENINGKPFVNGYVEYDFVAPANIQGLGFSIAAPTEDIKIQAFVYDKRFYKEAEKPSKNYDFVNSSPIFDINQETINAFNDALVQSKQFNTFLFFTDPHWYNPTIKGGTATREKAFNTLEYVYNRTCLHSIICGGDWLTHSDISKAIGDTSSIAGITKAKFGNNYYPIYGNHDNNYQGNDGQGGSQGSGTINEGTLINTTFARFGSKYYSFEQPNSTEVYVFDTGTDWVPTMDEYRWEQFDWYANRLLNNTKEHIIIALHILTNQELNQIESEGLSTQMLAEYVLQVSQAFNNKTTYTANGKHYDFSNAKGIVSFMICGHSHFDYNLTHKDIPIIMTRDAQTNGSETPAFDMCIVDYQNKQLKTFRIGTGSNRVITIL